MKAPHCQNLPQPLIKGPPHLRRNQRERLLLAWYETVNWCQLVGKSDHDPDTVSIWRGKGKRDTQERWRVNTPRMLQKAVYACRQWVIFFFIHEWVDLGKKSLVGYKHSATWQASSLEGPFAHWQPSPCFLHTGVSTYLMVASTCPLNFSLAGDPSQLFN